MMVFYSYVSLPEGKKYVYWKKPSDVHQMLSVFQEIAMGVDM